MSHQWKWPTIGRLAIGPSMGATSVEMAKTAVFRLAVVHRHCEGRTRNQLRPFSRPQRFHSNDSA